MLPNSNSELTEESFNLTPYFLACLKEALRMHALFPGQLRATGQDLVIEGYQVPKMVYIYIYKKHINHFKLLIYLSILCIYFKTDLAMVTLSTEQTYFANAEKFLPERWLRDEFGKPAEKPVPFTYLPFGYGPRSCVGQRVVEMKVQILTTR